MFNSIRWRLTMLMIALAILPSIAVGAILTYEAFNASRSQAEDLQSQVALRLADKVETTISERPRELGLIIDVRGLLDLSQPEQHTILSEMLDFDTDFDELALLDASGHEVVRVSRRELIAASALRYRSTAPEFQTPVSTRATYYSPVQFDAKTGDPLMTIALPVVDPRVDQISYVLVAEYRLRSLWDLFTAQNFASYDDAFLVAGGAEATPGTPERVIAHAETSNVAPDATFDIHNTSRETTGIRGQDVVLAIHSFQLGDTEFAVVAQRTSAEAFKQAYQTLYTIIAGLALIALISGIVGYLVLRQMTRPIVTLADAAEQIGAGDLSTQVNVQSRTELGTLARTFNTMTQQLREVVGTLEARVEARTRDLQLAAQVSEQMSTLLNPDQLLSQVVELIKANFDLYHVHIYLMDPSGDQLELAAGAGDAGQIMKAQAHRIPIQARSLVARVAREDTPVIVNDVSENPNFLANPLLPNTRSEAALPLSVGDRVLGVLDVQSDQVGRFEADMMVVLSTLAGQVAVSLDNARLFSEAARASRRERTLSAITNEIQRATNVEEVLQAATRELGKALGVPRTRIQLQLPRRDQGEPPDDGGSPADL
jgi:putative methionine-R-sulfoxide reductase with GAF domain